VRRSIPLPLKSTTLNRIRVTTVNNPLGEKKWMTDSSSRVVTDSKFISIPHLLIKVVVLEKAPGRIPFSAFMKWHLPGARDGKSPA
jgi:hypothetical protein